MEYTHVPFIQEGSRLIEGLTHVRLYCCKQQLFEHIFTYLCITRKQNRDMPTTKRKIKFSKILQILCTAKIKKQIRHIYI